MPEPPSAAALAAAPHIGSGRYALVSRIGEGGMGGVYAAWDHQEDCWRAVKVLLPEHARRKSLRRRFQREAESLMELDHPNLVQVLEVRDDEELPFIVMELLTGGSLQDWVLKHGPMPPRLATHAALQLCTALVEVHRLGIVHRDVKPQNVLVTRHGICKLTDFGMARTQEGGDTRTGTALGTIGYMAPEQLADSKSVDARADVFGVGATLYVLMCKASVRDLFRVADDPARMEGVPPPLVAVLTRCLEYERDDRYADAEALIDALNAALELLPEDPPDTPPLPRSERPGPPGAQDTWFSEIIPLMGDFEPSTEVPVQTSELPAPTPYVERPEQLYVVEPEPVSVLRDEITAPAQAPPPPAPRHGTTLFLALITAGVVGGAAALAVLGTLGWGAQHVNGAHEDHLAAGRALVEGVEQARPMVDELSSAGVSTRRVEIALRSLDAAPSDERVEASLAFIDSARVAAAGIPPRDRHATQVVSQRLERLEAARSQVQQTWIVWTEHAAHPAGQVAIAIGLADAP